ncbi:thioredoxin domain-containing protein [Patescibacteria group bacterium]|nr:thioredoxin domain-containing protein [Patescibacteria group bacterium]MBU1970478.1 thioredoxin domain-containing protein [Patescibacteria group bacterium]
MEKSSGIYLGRYAALGASVFVLILAFAAGFFAKAYFNGSTKSPATNVEVDGVTNQPQVSNLTLTQVREAFNQAIIKFGDSQRKVLFITVIDPSCPYCSIAAGKNPELNKQAGARFTLVSDGGTYVAPIEEMKKLVDEGQASFALLYRNGHGAGELAMKAFYCAYETGKFWPVHDLLMSSEGYDLINNTVRNDPAKVNELAVFLSPAIDQNTLKACLSSGKYDNQLDADTRIGDTLGAGGTPGFFINTQAFPGAYSFTEMQPVVDSFLQ